MSSKLIKIAVLIMLVSCAEQQQEKEELRALAKDYFATYQERSDFKKFLSFYDEKAVLEDMVSGERIVGRESLQQFFDWDNPDYQMVKKQALTIDHLLVDGNQIVASGYFNAFSWSGQQFEPMQFTTILTLANGKIIKHIDWINYPSTLIDYTNRKNSNDWILE